MQNKTIIWKDHKKLRHISESVSGITLNGRPEIEPYYIRSNDEVPAENGLEYTIQKPPENDMPDEVYQTSAGRIVLHDEGERGGYLEIGGKHICDGNFTTIFVYNDERYVTDSFASKGVYRFRLIRIFDDGNVETVYNSAEDYYYDSLGMASGAAMDAYCIAEDFIGSKALYFLCSGINTVNPERIRKVQFLLIYNNYRKRRHKQVIRIDLPPEKVEFSHATSIWSDGVMLSIGCDKHVIMVHMPDMDTEYWTGLDEDTVCKLLSKKRDLNMQKK